MSDELTKSFEAFKKVSEMVIRRKIISHVDLNLLKILIVQICGTLLIILAFLQELKP